MKNQKNTQDSTLIMLKKVVTYALILLLLFSVGNIAGKVSNVNIAIKVGNETSEQPTAVVTTTQATTAVIPSTEGTTVPVSATENSTEAPSTENKDSGTEKNKDEKNKDEKNKDEKNKDEKNKDNKKDKDTEKDKKTEKETEKATEKATEKTPEQSSSATKTKDEIIALYNEAVNKVKPEATKVTRNFKNTRYDTEKSVLPSALESMANPMVEKYVKDDPEPVEYLTKEEIIENFPVPKQDYSSKLTSADVTEATCNDNGSEYEITLKLASCTNPTAGVGVGAACHFMDVSSITSNEAASSMIGKFDAVYSDCVIKCKIDKATNRVTWANYYTPFCIDAVVKVVFSDISTVVYMSYERDYTITY